MYLNRFKSFGSFDTSQLLQHYKQEQQTTTNDTSHRPSLKTKPGVHPNHIPIHIDSMMSMFKFKWMGQSSTNNDLDHTWRRERICASVIILVGEAGVFEGRVFATACATTFAPANRKRALVAT